MKTILVTIAALSLSTAAVLAQDAAVTPDYVTVDANADGAVSWDELIVALPAITEDQFKAADLDTSGGLSAEEYAALAAA